MIFIKIYCMYDRKAELMNPPFQCENNMVAIRNFAMVVAREGSPDKPNVLNLYPEDFALYYLGDFDEQTMKFNQADIPTLLGFATEFLPRKRNSVDSSSPQ